MVNMSQDARYEQEVATQRRASILGMNYVDTSALSEKPLYKDLLSVQEMYQKRVVPIQVDQSNILFGITTTTSQQTLHELESRFNDRRMTFAIISDIGYREYMQLYDPPKKVTYQEISFSDQQSGQDLVAAVTATLEKVRSDDMLAYLVQQAFKLKASDLHLECQESGVRIRFRVDGVLHPIALLSYGKYKVLLSTIASAANVSTGVDEAQTGHINRTYKMVTGEEVTVNLRVETVPTVYGQDVVMRLFTMKMELLKIDNLNLSERERNVVDDIISHPTGMVLVVGPTGSGKTTTLYSLINTLNTEERKIITLEDPVEYFMPGVVQIPVHGDQNETGFAEKLRAVLRLDPDVVMVGEIRDKDTARTSLQAALTGHLVLSTFHASSASAALTRMLDFSGINLEDIAAPLCFEVEDRLKAELDIPVMHDDQHGTAIVTLAGLINATKITGRSLKDAKIVMEGAGAAGVAIAKLIHLYAGSHIVAVDSKGIINSNREGLTAEKQLLAQFNPSQEGGTLQDAIRDADIFIGVSQAGLLTADMVKTMAKDPIIFAMANPVPEIMPDVAKEAGAAVVATGRSDFPNQVNNSLAFPGIFRGALDHNVSAITDQHKIAAAEALAALVQDPTADKIIPGPFDDGIVEAVSNVIR